MTEHKERWTLPYLATNCFGKFSRKIWKEIQKILFHSMCAKEGSI